MVPELACIRVRTTPILTNIIIHFWFISLRNTKREDMVFISFQFWVLGMSVVALLNESIPHILASLLTHLMATAWAGFKVIHTANFRSDFHRVITTGACNKASLLPHYWEARSKAEIPSFALNIIALFVSSYLTWKLIKVGSSKIQMSSR